MTSSVMDSLKSIVRTRSICILIVLGVLGYVFHQVMESKVFPTASIDLVYSRNDILKMAQELSAKLGYSRPNMISSIEFNNDDQAKLFLERTYGQSEANRLMQQLPVWFWQCSFKKEFDKETSYVQLNPAGKLTNFTREFENDLRLPSLDQAAAKEKAIAFVVQQSQLPITQWELIKSTDKSQINRVDHAFEWEEATDYKGAHRRVRVDVCGDTIGLFDISLHTPESWDHSYKAMRSYNDLLGAIAFFGSACIALGTALLFVLAVKKKSFSFKAALIIGLIFAAAILGNSLNSFPSWANSYDPSEPYSSFLFKKVGYGILGAAIGGLLIALLYAAMQPMYRVLCPAYLPIQGWFTRTTLRSPQLFEAVIVGFAACGVANGYQIAYYLLGTKLGYWCPLQVNEFGTFGDVLPFLDALNIGVMAATMEEGLYRVMGLGIFQKLFRGNFWLANFFQALIWGFMHSQYPQQPSYARGVELTIEGLFDGWLLRRYGLLPCIIWHYLFDALCGVELLRAAPANIAWTAIIPIAIPLVIFGAGLVAASRKGLADDAEVMRAIATKESEDELAHAARDAHAEPETESTFAYSQPLSWKVRMTFAALAIAAIIAGYLTGNKPIGSGTPALSVNRTQAIERAQSSFQEQKIDVQNSIVSSGLSSGMTTATVLTYINESLGFARTKQLVETFESPLRWSARFVKQLSPFEYEAWMDQNGQLLSPDITLPEDAPGANLSEAEARTIAERFLEQHRRTYVPFKFLDAEKNVRKSRTDYKFTYAVPAAKAADAVFKVYVEVKGNLVAGVTHEWEVPDRWQWAYDRKVPVESALPVLRLLCSLSGVLLLLWFWIELIRDGAVRWKWPLAIGLGMFLIQLLAAINNYPDFYARYQPDRPLSNFIMESTVLIGASYLFFSFFGVVMASMAFAVLPKYFGRQYVTSALNLSFAVQPRETRASQRALWLDAILVVLCVGSLLWAGGALVDLLRANFAHEPPIVRLPGAMQQANSFYAPFGVVAGVAGSVILGICGLIVIPAVMKRYLGGRRWLYVIVIMAIILISDSRTKFLADYSLGVVPTMLAMLLLALVLLPQARKNFLVAILSMWFLLFLPYISTVYRFGMPLYASDVCVLLLLLSAPLLYFVYLQLRRQKIE